jgi:ankyrin repeat protein
MFSGFFSSQYVSPETKALLIKNIYQKNNDQVLQILAKYNNLLQKDFIDDTTNDTLLHLAARTKNIVLVKYLLSRKVNKEAINILNETALDIAIKNQSTDIVKMLLINESNQLRVNESNQFKKELENEKKIHKRKRDEFDMLVADNFTLIIDNKKLKKNNEELQKTVRTLSNSLKKK